MPAGYLAVLIPALILCDGATAGGVVYQWEDEKGQLHFSDSVPDKYKCRPARRSPRHDSSALRFPQHSRRRVGRLRGSMTARVGEGRSSPAGTAMQAIRPRMAR